MTRSRKAFAIFLGLLGTWLVVSACSKSYSHLKVRSDYDPMADFSRLKTYAFMENPVVESRDARVNRDFVNSRIQKAVMESLDQHDLRRVGNAQADFYVAYQAILSREEKVHEYLSLDMADLGSGEEMQSYTRHFDQGTLLLSLVDAKTRKPLYTGSAQAEVDLDVDWEEKEKRIQMAIHEILKGFPPQ
jgi:hypothetical protein